MCFLSSPATLSAVGTRSNNGEGAPGERQNVTNGSTNPGVAQTLPVRSVLETAIPHPLGVSVSAAVQPGEGVYFSQPTPDSVSLSSIVADVNSRLRDLVGNVGGGSTTESGILPCLIPGAHCTPFNFY